MAQPPPGPAPQQAARPQAPPGWRGLSLLRGLGLLPLALWRVARLSLHVLHGMAVMALRFPSLDAAGRHARIGWWSAGLLRAVGVQLRLSGTPRPGATLLIANHVSWLDIAALHAAVPHARFVSKADVLHWPLLGWLVKGAGTLFIERERKRDALRVVHAMAEALRAGETVAVFPEGTTGVGAELLPFHANLLQAAIATATPIQPAVLRFADAQHRFSPAVVYVGDTSLLQSLWWVATARGLVVHVDLLLAQASAHADRRALAETLRRQMSDQLLS
jgi:1-acyl-sn-glycerol-3-phosphate acyltransferase